MSTTLEILFTSSGVQKAAEDIKSVGTAAITVGTTVKKTSDTIKQASTEAVSFGQKLKSVGSSFQSTVANVATFSLSIVNLQRSYRDLGESQIAVDKSNLKLSKSHEGLAKAQAKVIALQKAGKTGTKEYEQALLDQKQATDQLGIATNNAAVAQKHFKDNQQDFWIGLVPTIVSAGGTLSGVFSKLGGEGGIGGLASKFTAMGSAGGSSITGLISKFGPLTLAIGAAGIAMADLLDLMQKGDQLKSMNNIIMSGKATIGQLLGQKQGLLDLKNRPDVQLTDFFLSGPLGKMIRGGPSTNTLVSEMIKSIDSEVSRREGIDAVNKLLTDVMTSPLDPTTKAAIKSKLQLVMNEFGNDSNWKNPAFTNTTKGIINKQLADVAAQVTTGLANDPLAKVIKDKAIQLATLADAQGRVVLNRFVNAMVGTGTGKGIGAALAAAGLDFTPMDAVFQKMTGQFDKLATQGLGGWNSAVQMSVDAQKAFDDTMKTSWTAFDDVVNTTTQGAADGIAAYNQSVLDMQAKTEKGVNVLLAAWNKLHPDKTTPILGKQGKKKGKKIGEKTTTFALPEEKAQDFLTAFESALGQRVLTGQPASAEKFAVAWANTAAKKMGGVAGAILKPIEAYIQAHKTEAPGKFIKGLTDYLGTVDLTKNFSDLYLPSTTAAKKSSITAGSILSDIKLDTNKLLLGKQLSNDLAGAIKNIPGNKVAKVTATVTGQNKVDLMNKALANAKSKHITLSVSAQIGANVQQAVALASRFSGMGSHPGRTLKVAQHGMHETVRQPTLILAGEKGAEDVHIDKPGKMGGGGGGTTIVKVYLGNEELKQYIHYTVNEGQGASK